MRSPSTIEIKVAGVDVTNKVLFASARFESQLGAVPGIAEITIKDMSQTFDATTGDEVTLAIDGVLMWGGYVITVGRRFAVPVSDTSAPGAVETRQFVLSCLDYNILFDKRVIHNPAAPLKAFPFFKLDKTMGWLIRNQLCASYLDIADDGLDTTTYVDNGFVPRFDNDGNPDPNGTKDGSWPQQGSYWRQAMADFAQFGFVYYIDAAKNLHFHEIENVDAPWGFSDVPNKQALPSVGATYGMREYEDDETAGSMANEAFVWGGSEFAGAAGGTVFKRAENAASIAAHNRWQFSEVRFGDLRTQGEVTARANVIVRGNTTGAVGGDTSRGLSVDEKSVSCIWFAHDVPMSGGSRAHLLPSMVVPFEMFVLSDDGGVTPRVFSLPLRMMTITFPTLPSDGSDVEPLTYVKFESKFGVQLDDPWYFWKLLRDLNRAQNKVVSSANDSSTEAVYGAIGSFEPTPATDNSATVFSIPFAYIEGTTQVFKGPAEAMTVQSLGVQYTESNPAAGQITFASPPSSAHSVWIVCRIAGGLG
jgi:hypothetical protein